MADAYQLTDFDEEAQKKGSTWDRAQLWHWVDAVAWIAKRSTDLMSVLSAYRDQRDRMHSEAVGEGACRTVLLSAISEDEFAKAGRELRTLCADGVLSAVSVETGRNIAAADWLGHREPIAANMPHVLIPSSELRSLAETARAVSKAGRKKGQDTYPEDAAIIVKIITLCDEQGLSLPKAINQLIAEVAPVHLDDASKKKRIRPKVLAQRPDLAN